MTPKIVSIVLFLIGSRLLLDVSGLNLSPEMKRRSRDFYLLKRENLIHPRNCPGRFRRGGFDMSQVHSSEERSSYRIPEHKNLKDLWRRLLFLRMKITLTSDSKTALVPRGL